MKWNWQQPDWPLFSYDAAAFKESEAAFFQKSIYLLGTYTHIQREEKTLLIIDLLSEEAYRTSEIEGEFLNRDSIRSSIRQYFGLQPDKQKKLPRESGIAEMLMNLHQTYAQPLTHQMLFDWHLMLMRKRHDLNNIGSYRTHEDAMQVVSGSIDRPKVHFEAPPSSSVPEEMEQFVQWFNQSAQTLPALIRASITHLYFVTIHPFEDGNGRIARALVEKALAQAQKRPTLIALSHVILKHKKSYYAALEEANKTNHITNWLNYFSDTILNAQDYAQSMVEFIIKKSRLYDRVRDQLNERQAMVVARIFQEGIEGFKGGLSAENYIRITKTSRATATRDLQDLVDKSVLTRTGERKSTRYYLNLEN